MMCRAIDNYSTMPYVHVVIDDGSEEPLPISPSSSRRILSIHRDVPGVVHKNGLGQALQLGYDFAHQQYFNEASNPVWEHVFVIESDVIVQEQGWDQKQVDLIKTLPHDWGTVDAASIDEEGKVTYPCTVSPRHDEYSHPDFEWIHYPDYQCCLFNPKTFAMGMKFGDSPSHFDVLFGRKMEQLGMKAYRAKNLKVLHVAGGGNSRQYLA